MPGTILSALRESAHSLLVVGPSGPIAAVSHDEGWKAQRGYATAQPQLLTEKPGFQHQLCVPEPVSRGPAKS